MEKWEILEVEAKKYEERAYELDKKCSTTASFKNRAACKAEVRNLRRQAHLRRNLAEQKKRVE